MAHASFYLFPTHAKDKKENNIAVTMMNASMQQELSRRRLRARFLPIVGCEELRRFLRDRIAFQFPFEHGVVGVDEMSKALKDYYGNPMKDWLRARCFAPKSTPSRNVHKCKRRPSMRNAMEFEPPSG